MNMHPAPTVCQFGTVHSQCRCIASHREKHREIECPTPDRCNQGKGIGHESVEEFRLFLSRCGRQGAPLEDLSDSQRAWRAYYSHRMG